MKKHSPRIWQLRDETWTLPREGAIMGILNVTPDSFSDGGTYNNLDSALLHAKKLIAQGADIIDIGGESTRPGADEVPIHEERQRTIPLITELRKRYPRLRLSIDTRHSAIAEEALLAGADIINDITGLRQPDMIQVCTSHACGIILMHMQGEPKTMQEQPHYQDIIAEVRDFFTQRIQQAEAAGIRKERICVDPGIGFGKTLEHNLMLIKQLEQLRPYPSSPIMMALSRKRFMGEILQDTAAGRSSLSTCIMSLLSAQNGAELHRVHDVQALKQSLTLAAALTKSTNNKKEGKD